MCTKQRLCVLALVISMCASALSPAITAAQGDLTLRFNEVNSQSFPEIEVTVTVVDPHGIPISGLDASKFEASEEGVRVPLTEVEEFINPEVTIAVMLVIDASGSMAGEPLEKAKQSAVHFIDTLGPDDEAAVIAFGDSVNLAEIDPTKEIDFTTDKNAVKNLINRITTEAGKVTTPLYDAIFKAVDMTVRHPAGNRVVIVFTDGREGDADGNQVSSLSAEAPIDRAEEGNISIFTIGLGRNADENYLKEVAIRTGGTYEFAPDADKLSAIYQGVANQLRKQYRLKYVSKVRADGQKHKVTIKAITPQGEVDNTTEFLAVCPPGRPGIRLFYLQPSEVPGEEPEVKPLDEGQEVQDVLTVEPDISSCNPIARVEYYLNGELRFTVDTPPYHFIWDTREERVAQATQYTLLVRAYDSADPPNVGEKSVGLTVLPPPGPSRLPTWQIAIGLLVGLLLLVLLLFALQRRRRAREALAPAYVPATSVAPPAGWEETTAPEVPSVPPAPEAITAYGETVPEMPRVGVAEAPPVAPTVVLGKEPPAMAWLIMEKGDRPGQEFRLHAGDTLIGRAGTCDIVLNDPTVSRQHAKVRLEGEDFYLHDLAATNPTRVNGQEVGRHRLVEGDRIELGNTVLVFKRIAS